MRRAVRGGYLQSASLGMLATHNIAVEAGIGAFVSGQTRNMILALKKDVRVALLKKGERKS